MEKYIDQIRMTAVQLETINESAHALRYAYGDTGYLSRRGLSKADVETTINALTDIRSQISDLFRTADAMEQQLWSMAKQQPAEAPAKPTEEPTKPAENPKISANAISAARTKAEWIDGQLENLCAMFDLFCEGFVDHMPPKGAPDYVCNIAKHRACVADAIGQLMREAAEAAEALPELLRSAEAAAAEA